MPVAVQAVTRSGGVAQAGAGGYLYIVDRKMD
jgi:hypothetical protein